MGAGELEQNGLWLPGQKVRAETGNENGGGGPTPEGRWGEASGQCDTHIPVCPTHRPSWCLVACCLPVGPHPSFSLEEQIDAQEAEGCCEGLGGGRGEEKGKLGQSPDVTRFQGKWHLGFPQSGNSTLSGSTLRPRPPNSEMLKLGSPVLGNPL